MCACLLRWRSAPPSWWIAAETIAFRPGRYVITAADGYEVGAFVTFAWAEHEDRIATAEARAIDRW